MERDERAAQEAVVFEGRLHVGMAVERVPEPPPGAVPVLVKQKLRAPLRFLYKIGPPKRLACPAERRDRKAVPRGYYLTVGIGRRPLPPYLQKRFLQFFHLGRHRGLGAFSRRVYPQHVPVLVVAVLGDREVFKERPGVRAERGLYLAVVPEVIGAFLAAHVRVLRRVKPA